MSAILQPGSPDPNVRLWAKIAALEQRLAALERAPIAAGILSTAVPVGAEGAPGALAITTTPARLWIKVGATWRFTALT
jgi:hypothetical protein